MTGGPARAGDSHRCGEIRSVDLDARRHAAGEPPPDAGRVADRPGGRVDLRPRLEPARRGADVRGRGLHRRAASRPRRRPGRPGQRPGQPARRARSGRRGGRRGDGRAGACARGHRRHAHPVRALGHLRSADGPARARARPRRARLRGGPLGAGVAGRRDVAGGCSAVQRGGRDPGRRREPRRGTARPPRRRQPVARQPTAGRVQRAGPDRRDLPDRRFPRPSLVGRATGPRWARHER